MWLHKWFISLAMVVFWILTISSCAFPSPMFDSRVRPVVSDETLLSGEPCLPPCWYDIVPGSTGTAAALEKIRLLEFVNPTSVERTNRDLYPGTDDSIDWKYQGTNDYGGDIFIADDTVKWIRISHPNHLILEEVTATIGEPDWIWAGRAGGAGNHHIYRFVYEEMGLMLESRMYGDNSPMPENVIVSSDIEIDEAFYFAPRTLAQYLTDIQWVSEDQLENIKNAYQEWSGFGSEIATAQYSP